MMTSGLRLRDVLTFLLCMNMACLVSGQDDEKEVDPARVPTHKQVRTLKPVLDGEPAQLNTFMLDRDNTIVACVMPGTRLPQEVSATEAAPEGGAVQWYSADGALLHETRLAFSPTAVTQAPNGTFFIAGDGKIASLDASGTLLHSADFPWLGDLESLRREAEEEAQAMIEENKAAFESQIETYRERVARLEEKPEDERSDRDKLRLEAARIQLEAMIAQSEEMEEAYSQFYSVDAMLRNRMRITAIAANSNDLFVCASDKSYGYEVWRLNHAFEQPKRVVEALSGCCGQCDIQATEDNLVVAANTTFSVDLLNRDGEEVFSFGERGGDNGFGSCCNPMNVRCCDNGDILTAESSIGWIKRFDQKGNLLATIGKAKIGGGCKHVAIGWDKELDRYYMQYEDKSEICVLVPIAEAPEMTEDELAAKEARDGLGRRLIGHWTLDTNEDVAVAENALGESSDADDEDSCEDDEDMMVFTVDSLLPSEMTFLDDGTLKSVGGMPLGNQWAAVSQKGNDLVVDVLDEEGIANLTYHIRFDSENEAHVTAMMGGDALGESIAMKRAAESSEGAPSNDKEAPQVNDK